jgi:hypothetical protein
VYILKIFQACPFCISRLIVYTKTLLDTKDPTKIDSYWRNARLLLHGRTNAFCCPEKDELVSTLGLALPLLNA